MIHIPGFFAPTQEMSFSFAQTQDMSCPFLCLYLCSGTRSCFIDSYIESNKFPLGGEPYVLPKIIIKIYEMDLT